MQNAKIFLQKATEVAEFKKKNVLKDIDRYTIYNNIENAI